MANNTIRVGITHGDINSISYEVILNTLSDSRVIENCTPIFYGSAKVAAYYRKVLNLGNLVFNQVKTPEEAVARRLNMVSIEDENLRVELGKSTQMAGEASFAALELAIAHLKEGAIDVLVTGPINKDNIQSEKFHFNGHTEYLQSNFGGEPLMLMVADEVRVGVVTGHIPLKEVPQKVTTEAILSKLKIFDRSLRQDFTLTKPRIAVLSLNPHAGDNGLLGNEETEIILPAIKQARDLGIMAMGPYASDGFFGSGSYANFDGVLAMYHDQGLTPFKTIAGEHGVNFTAGLDIIRTSPAHGTAYELAGKGEASDESFRTAFFMACDIFERRNKHLSLEKNQMKEIDLSEFKNAIDQTIKLV
jgi:4-hydroxythreonine-4-phosphate dehydrogenase